MAAVNTRKRSAPDDDGTERSATAGGKKRARVTFGSIYNYERLEVLGEGTYGVVFMARDRRTGETVAVKWIRGEDEGGRRGAPDVRALFREAGCLAACRGHPNIVEIKDVAADAVTGAAFLVMEFVGTSLRSILKETRQQFSEAETREYMRQLLSGAERMHAAGLIHRDLKPENVLVGPGGELKICDFGMATPVKPDGEPYRDSWVGTLCYRSPEQVAGNPCYGPAVDMWALGCVMAELLTGNILFRARTEDDMITMVLDMLREFNDSGLRAFETFEAFRDLPKISLAGRELLAGLLNFDCEKRLTAAAALQHRWFTEDLTKN